MREIKCRSIQAVIASLMFTIGAQVPGAGLIRGALVAAVQTQSDDSTLSFGEGRFFIDGKAPKGITEFEYLYLEGGSFKLGPDKKRMVADSPASLKGEVQGKRGRTFKLKKATMERDTLTFESEVSRGVSFQFRGTVFKGASEYDFVEIKGHLSKLVNGTKVAEADVTFSYLEPSD